MYRLLLLFVVMASFYIPSAASSALSKPLRGQNIVTKTNPYTSTAWIGSAITAGASLLGGLLGNNSQNKNIDKQIRAQQEENQKNREYNLQLAQMQNAWNQEQWERENEYNSPTAQMERMRKAGLNPDLMMTGGTGSLAASSPQMTSGAPSSPQDMSILGQRPTLGQAVQSALRDSMIGAQIDNIKANTEKTRNESSILASDAKFRDAFNQGSLEMTNSVIRLNNSKIELNDSQISKLRSECSKLDAETKNVILEYDKIRASISNLDASTALARLHHVLDSKKAEAEIQKLAASTALDFANAKEIVTLLSAKLLNLEESTKEIKIRGANIQANTDRLEFDLEQDSSFEDVERTTNVLTDITDALVPVAALIGTAFGGNYYETVNETKVSSNGTRTHRISTKRGRR